MKFTFGLISIVVLGFLIGCPAGANDHYPVAIKDIVGRSITIEHEPRRVILGTGRTIYALDILFEDDLFERIIAWRTDLARNDDDSYQIYLQHFPKVSQLHEVGLVSKGEFDVEFAINIEGDLLLLDRSHYSAAKQSGLLDELSAVGMKTVFIDFKDEPLKNTRQSMFLLGQVFNRSKAALEFNRFYQMHLENIHEITSTISQRRRVFIERAAGINGLDQCCRTWGDTNLGHIAEVVGLDNIGTDLLPGSTGEISVEKLLIENPDMYVMSAANWGKYRADSRNIPLGYSVNESQAQKAFPDLLSRVGFSSLDATRDQEVYALFHQFYNSPFNIIAALYLAKWGYPEKYADLDPETEFEYLHRKYLIAKYAGTFGLRFNPEEEE